MKDAVKKVLASYSKRCYIWSNWPVPAGYGAPMLDCIGFIDGKGFAIETKAPGGKPTPRQLLCIEQMREAGARVFVIDTTEPKELEGWLERVCEEYEGRCSAEAKGASAASQPPRRASDT